VYNSETNTVEESINKKFYDKKPNNKMLELVKSFVEICVIKDASAPEQASKPIGAFDSLEAGATFEVHLDEEDFEESHDGSEEATQSKRTFKYKSSHLEDIIIGNKDSPLKIRSTFIYEHSMLGLLSMIEPTSVNDALSDDGWIAKMQEEMN